MRANPFLFGTLGFHILFWFHFSQHSLSIEFAAFFSLLKCFLSYTGIASKKGQKSSQLRFSFFCSSFFYKWFDRFLMIALHYTTTYLSLIYVLPCFLLPIFMVQLCYKQQNNKKKLKLFMKFIILNNNTIVVHLLIEKSFVTVA